MKKIFILLMLLSFSLYPNSLSKVNTLQAKVSEKTFINKNTKEKTYNFQLKYPDKAYKEILSPKINTGEKYIYNGKKKQVFYPLLGDTFVDDIDSDENYILQSIKLIKDGRKNYTEENGEIKTLDMGDGINLVFSNYKEVDNLNFPYKVEIFQGNRLVSQIEFSDVKLNKSLDDKQFIIK